MYLPVTFHGQTITILITNLEAKHRHFDSPKSII